MLSIWGNVDGVAIGLLRGGGLGVLGIQALGAASVALGAIATSLILFSGIKALVGLRLKAEFVKPTVDAIIKGARTGTIGDGKIFIVPLEQCIRIRSGDTGSDAIG